MKRKILFSAGLIGFLSVALILTASAPAKDEKAKSARQQKIEEERRAREEAERAAKRAEMEKRSSRIYSS